MSDRKKIVLADDQFLISEALQKLLAETDEYIVVAVLQSAIELETYLLRYLPDILILDIAILYDRDIQIIAEIKNNHPGTAIVVLSNRISRNEIYDLKKFGIRNILYKTAGRNDIFESIRAASSGKQYYSPEITEMLLDAGEKKAKRKELNYLTPSEKEIIGLIASGLTTKEIATKKNVSFHTVMTHRKNIFRKLGVNNVSELIMYTMKNGLIDPIDYYI